MRVATSVALSILIAVVAAAAPASAEWFLDGYLGIAVIQNSSVEVEQARGSSSQDITYGSSVAPGMRFGRWTEATPWLGFAVDVSYFGPQNDIQVIPISALIMGRLSYLKDSDFPDGALRPYAAVGPGLFITNVNGDLAGVRNLSDTVVDIGVDLRLGVVYYVQPNLGLLAEYRFTHVSPTFSTEVGGTSRDVDTTFNTHALHFGVSFRF